MHDGLKVFGALGLVGGLAACGQVAVGLGALSSTGEVTLVTAEVSTTSQAIGSENLALGEVEGARANFAQADQTDINSDLPVAVVKLPRTGGDFNHRWATVVVPQPSPAVSAEGGAMRWYDLHLATMVALTADQFCGYPSARGAYFNYEADGGSLFMGQYFIDCDTAQELMATFGQEHHTWVVMEAIQDTEAIHQYVPALSDAVMPKFRRQVADFFVPECSAHYCPGDRI